MENHMNERGFKILLRRQIPLIFHACHGFPIRLWICMFLKAAFTWHLSLLGKYELKNERFRMPLTMQIHHAAADGFHISRFFSELQK